MGFGDVKLMLAIGWLTGLVGGISVLVYAFWIGGIVGLLLIALTRNYRMKSEIAFGPFLIVALCLVEGMGMHVSALISLWQ